MILLPLPYDVEKRIHNLMGLFLYKDEYKKRYYTKSPTPTKPAVYDEKIMNNATNMVRAKAQAVHTSKIADCLLIAATERESLDFIITVVEDTWICKLWEPVMFYTAVTPSEILARLQTLCGGLHALDVLALKNETKHFHLDMEGTPSASTRSRMHRNNPRERANQ